MAERTGTCRGCGTRFRVPESFVAETAKCKKCGGVVEIVAGGAPPAATAREREAAAPPKEAAPSPSPRSPHRSEPPAERFAPPRLRAGASGARPGTSRTIIRTDAAAGAGRPGASPKRPAPPKRSGNPLVLGGSIVLILGAVVAGVLVYQKSGTAPTNEPVRVAEAPAPPEAIEEEPVAPASQEPLEATVAETSRGTEGERASAPGESPAPRRIIPDVDLAAIEDLQPLPETSPEEWAEMEEWMRLVVDRSSGVQGVRARERLVVKGKAAFPVILNALKRLDFAMEEGMGTGAEINVHLLQAITNGRNFGYYRDLEPDSVKRNRLIVEAWIKRWHMYKDDAAAWDRFVKAEGGEEDPMAEAGKPAEEGKKPKKPADPLGLETIVPR